MHTRLDTNVLMVYNSFMTTMTATTLPTLYKITSTGATQEWTISVEGSTIVKRFGQTGGKIQEARDTITEGKNVGRANETTPEQQAQSEAQSQWEKKLKGKGYVQSVDAAVAGEVDERVAGGIDPMLAHSFAKQGHKITYPAYTQPKLDGHRCIAVITDGVCTLWTRTRKPITGVPHINAALEAANLPNCVLDGELYNHDYKDNFEALGSFIKRPEPKPGHEVVQYHVYDIVNDQTFTERIRTLCDYIILRTPHDGPLVFVETERVSDEDEALEFFDEYTSRGYEGSMLRNADSLYENKRSYGLQKVKEFLDSEYKITEVTEGRGKMAGKAIFVCETADGKPFRVKMKGTLDSLRQYVDDPTLALGRLLTVQYQNLTADGVPRFPIGLRLREDI
jgi:DNA ligase-1